MSVERSFPERRDPPWIAEDGDLMDALLLDADSERDPVLSIVLPTLNEEESIGACIEKIKAAIVDLGVPAEIIVSDSSTDRTPDIASSMGATVVTPDGEGYGYAYRYAFERARGEYIVMGDADTTYDFEDIPRLLEPVAEGRADICMGSRFEGEIKQGAMPPLHRYIGNPLLTKFLNLFYGAGVSDAHSGFRVLSRDALETLELKTDGMEFASEMVMDAGARGLRIEEVPITYHRRGGEAKLNSFRDGWRHVRFMLVNAPTYLFSLPCVLFCSIGVLAMLISLFGMRVLGLSFGIHTAIAGSFLTMIGHHVGSLAVFSTIAGDPIRALQDPVTGWIRENFRLEHGTAAGVLLFALGSGYLGYVLAEWIAADFLQLSSVVPNMIAFTAAILGVQTVFTSFFFSILADA